MQRRDLLAGGALLGLAACTTPPWPPQPGAAADPLAARAPALRREWRAAWVASVANIDWPSRPGLDTAVQRAEADAMLDTAARLQLNALILQVRPSADALYPSPLEPWSEYLTGSQGRDPGWDPLAHWLAGAHARGIELHVWINPLRARAAAARGPEAAAHIAQRLPDVVRRYGRELWIDPAEPQGTAQTLAVAADLLSRYAVDGLHIDDYFYPYAVKDAAGNELDFPDDVPWQRYLASGGALARADWRRAQVDGLVQQLHATVRRVRPAARFGISPFGLMKPDVRPAGVSGFSQYDRLYAHVERWLAEGWLDYLTPQLYWPREPAAQAFGALFDGWQALNPRARAIWPGLFTSRAADPLAGWGDDEIPAQIARVRAAAPLHQGHAHFSLRALHENRRGIATRLRETLYAEAALPPALPWLGQPAPLAAPGLLSARETPQGRLLGWAGVPGAQRYAVQAEHADGRWTLHTPYASAQALPPSARAVRVAAVDAGGQLGAWTSWPLP